MNTSFVQFTFYDMFHQNKLNLLNMGSFVFHYQGANWSSSNISR